MCEPTMIAAATLATSAGTAAFSASSQISQGNKQARLSIMQSLRESQAGFDEAGRVSNALLEQYDETGAALIEQERQTSEALRFQIGDLGKALTEQLASTSQSAIDQAARTQRSYGLAMEFARRNAELSLAQGNVEENRVREETGRQLASQTAYFSAANLDPTYGSPLALQAMGAAQGEADALIVRSGAIQEAAGFAWQELTLATEAEDTVASLKTGVDSAFTAARRQMDSAGGAAALALDGLRRTTGLKLAGGARTLQTQIDSTYATAGTRASTGQAAAAANASNARRAGQVGATTTLLNTAQNWASLAMGGKLAPLGIKGV